MEHKCKETSIKITKHPDNFWWLDKTIGMIFHLCIEFCPFCGKDLHKESDIEKVTLLIKENIGIGRIELEEKSGLTTQRFNQIIEFINLME